MKKIIICPDSFKGTLSAREAADTIIKAFNDASDDYKCICMPIADGGEGTIDAMGAAKHICNVTGPNFKKIESFWGSIGDTAVIEMAACAGLPIANPANPSTTTTYGVGELIKDALDCNYRKFIVALGGSATNDMGCGMASAVGLSFYDKNGNKFIPTGETLSNIENIDYKTMDKRISESSFVTMCDIDNPLYGQKGAAYVFAPQKGADENMVEMLDCGLRHLSDILINDGIDVSQLPGGGAAGGCGAAMKAFFSSEMKLGIDVILEASDFESQLEDASLIITGEGKFDSQSIDGKAISGIAARAKRHNVPLIVLAGAAKETPEAYTMGVTAVFSIQREALPFSEAKLRNAPDMYKTAFNIASLISNIQ